MNIVEQFTPTCCRKPYWKMNQTQAVFRYFEAWNRRDARSICNTLATGGTYTDPTVPSGVSGAGFLALAEGFIVAFADLSFDQ